jgi:uncharacterized damage-inducible protein DinB
MILDDAKPLEGYQDPYGLLCAILQDGTREWRWEMDPELPAEAVVWQPHPNGHSIGALMFHIVTAEVFWFEQVVLQREIDKTERKLLMVDELDAETPTWPIPPRQPLSWYFDLHDRIRARTLAAVREWLDPETVLPHHGRGVTPRWILGHVIQHEAYHGGQAVLLQSLWKQGKKS